MVRQERRDEHRSRVDNILQGFAAVGWVPVDGAGIAMVRAMGSGATALGAPRCGRGGRRLPAGGTAVVRNFACAHSAAISARIRVRLCRVPARSHTHTDDLLQGAGPEAAGACPASIRSRAVLRLQTERLLHMFCAQGVWQGLLTGAGCLARALGPLFVAAVYARRGPDATFGITAGLTLAALMALRLVYARLRPPSTPEPPAPLARELQPLGADT